MAEDIEYKKRVEKSLAETAEAMKQMADEVKAMRLELQIVTGAVVK